MLLRLFISIISRIFWDFIVAGVGGGNVLVVYS